MAKVSSNLVTPTGGMTTPSGLSVTGDPATYDGSNAPKQSAEDHTSRFAGLIGNMIKYATGASQNMNPTVQQGLDEYGKISGQIQDLRTQAAGGRGALLSSGMTSPIAQGRGAVIAQTAAAQESALGAQQQAALQKAGVGITAQNATTGALGTAANLAQPQVAAFGNAFYDPTTGKATDAGNNASLNPIANIDSIAQQVANGQISPAQGYALGGNVPNFQGALNQAILKVNPQFNQASAQAAYDTKHQNAVTAGTAPTSAFASAYGGAYEKYNDLRGQAQNVDGLGNLLLQVAQSGDINTLDLTIGNKTIAELKRNLSTAEQTKFDSALSAFSGAASLLLASGSGQIPTAVSANIAKIADGTLSLPALTAMVEQARAEGVVKLSTAASLVNVPGGSIGAPQVGGGGSYEDYLRSIGQ